MKKYLLIFILIYSFPSYCQIRIELSTKESQIFWKGKNGAGFGGHEGTLQLKNGFLSADTKGKLTGGSFEIDMNSIKNTDVKPEKSQHELEDHLKGDDFFGVKKYPIAVFKIVKIEPTNLPNKYSILGDFTMKGITNRIVFIAAIGNEKDKIIAKGDLTINRSQWGITYKTQTQWVSNILNNLKNDFISEEIPIKLDLIFLKGK